MTKRLAELKKRIEQAGGREKVFRMFDAEATPLRTAGIEVETILSCQVPDLNWQAEGEQQ